MVDPTRGVLYPQRLPQFHRLPAGEASDLVTWFWIPEWTIPDGQSSRQDIVAYPALNLVVEHGACTLTGATTRMSFRDLRGDGWAVGAMLRPAAVAALEDSPVDLIDRAVTSDAPDLVEAVSTAMDSGDGRRERAVTAFADWLVDRAGLLGAASIPANAFAHVLMGP